MTTSIEALLRQGPADGDQGLDDALVRFARRAEDEGLVEVAVATTDTPVGPYQLAATDEGLVRICLLPNERFEEELASTISPRVVARTARLDPVRRQLDEYFEGRRHRFDLPIDWRLSRGFRLAALRRLYEEVGYGETVSYKELATRVGSPKAFRAVGSAMATNPVPVIVPCHRVLDSAGRLHGYGGGLPMKEALLRLEGAIL
jgi:methylated-DNA-[protein]-cysteine S-methyltransferase